MSLEDELFVVKRQDVDRIDVTYFDHTEGRAEVRVGKDLVTRALEVVGVKAKVEVHKYIPVGAGLGGGSSDAAAILRWHGSFEENIPAKLGADVEFCVRGGRALITGIGEIVMHMPYERTDFTLLTPPLSVSTAEVYARWDELGGPQGENENDLEPAAIAVEPQLIKYRDQLGEATGQVPRLAGSGSTWYVHGAFPDAGIVVNTVGETRDDSNDAER